MKVGKLFKKWLPPFVRGFFLQFLVAFLIANCFSIGQTSRFFSEVTNLVLLGQMKDLAGNSNLYTYENCDSKSEKSAPMYCFEGTPLHSPGSWD